MDSINLVAIQNPDLIPTLIEHGAVTMEGAQEAQNAFSEFVKGLEGTWTPDAIKKHVLEQMRAKYLRAKKYLEKLELDNRDARVQGVSFKDRQAITKKIAGGQISLKEIAKRGEEYKHSTFTVKDIVTPLDMGYIQKEGFEKYLEFTYLF